MSEIEQRSDDLTTIASEVNQAHEECERAWQTTVGLAIRIGLELITARSLVKHGEWLTWMRKHLSFSTRTAQGYMRLARNRPELEKDASVAHLGVRSALGALSTPRDDAESATSDAEKARHFDEALAGIAEEVAGLKIELEELDAEGDQATLDEYASIAERASALQNAACETKMRCEREAGRLLNELDESGSEPEHKR